jgi:aminoglycoside phosphotransferase (APT) family kinase protein
LAALAAWLDAQRPGLRSGELSGEVIAGGKSNLTYRITDGTSTWALRRPPLAHVLPTAHDMAREFRVVSALAGTGVPVPPVIALCPDADVLGAPFYLMGFVDGVVLDKPEILRTVDYDAATRTCELLMDTLADLHDVDPVAVGLADFGRPEGFLARQVKRWHQQWQASETRPLESLAQTVERLTSTLPDQSPAAIVHGDYRLTNVMFSPDLRTLVAVVDWEMATLGDPLTDVALLLAYHALARLTTGQAVADACTAPGFLSDDEVVERYSRGGRDLSDLGFYLGLAYFKIAVILEGIHYRHLHGQTVGEGFDQVGDAVEPLLEAGLSALKEHR